MPTFRSRILTEKMGLSLGPRLNGEGLAVFWGPNYYVEGVRETETWIAGGKFVKWPEWIKQAISRVSNQILCAVYDHEFLTFIDTGKDNPTCGYCCYRERHDPVI